MTSSTRVKLVAVALSLFVLVPFQNAAGQKNSSRPKARNTSELRRAFVEAFGEDFELVRDELARRSTWHGGGQFWLAHAKPKRSGHFKLKYKYRYVDRVRPKDPLYEFVEHEIPVRVSPRGCRRRVQDRNYADVCLGDTIIVPVVLDDFTGHTFTLTGRELQPPSEPLAESLKMEVAARAEGDKKLHAEPVPNPAAEFLKYVGSSAYSSPHRAPGFTMSFYATFEALKPGAFNLSVGARVADDLPLGSGRGGGVPVIIVERGAPLTLLASGEYVNSYGGGFSSGTGNGYLTTPLIMQPGDRITLQFHGYSVRGFGRERGAEADPSAAVKKVAPVISMRPFYVNPEEGFNQLIVEHLPVKNPSTAPR
ncbi:MAG TPA: hypothetical protein VFS10_20880 [Pyrinomonadaceae bacterium]|nr:hypothetical protein [Pyrinomonadaceae bacterium]